MNDADRLHVVVRSHLAGCLFSLLATMAAGGCAKSDPVTGSAGGGSSEGGDDGEGGGEDDEEAGPETGVGAGDSTSGQGGAEGDPPSSGGHGAGEATSSSSGAVTCGDGTCQVDEEGCDTCPADCGACEAECGDGTCNEVEGESCSNCATDCGACPICGDGVCDEPAEDCERCFEDCGICPCEPDDLETNDASSSASPVALNTEYADLSVCSGDVDWHEFAVSGTRTITLTFRQAQGDLDMEIFSEATLDYVTGAYSHDDDETVVLSGQPSGAYWVRVYGYMNATNPDYAIEVSN